jgi:hypothetical protein
LNDGVARMRRGRRERWYASHLVSFAEYPEPVRAWYDGDLLAVLETDYPALPMTSAALANLLGEPEARLDCYLDVLLLRAAEWVYPQRGLSVRINPATQIWLRVTAFGAMTLEAYLDDVRWDMPPAEI